MLQEQLSKIQKNLRSLHDKFSEMKKAGKMKLKRAMVTTHHPTGSKETEVCEFDFSNYPYYYNYPQHNISLEEEDVQMAFVKEITSFVTDDFGGYKREHPEQGNDSEFLALLNPCNTLKQTHQTLYNSFKQRISYLDCLQEFYLNSLRVNIQTVSNSILSHQSKQRQLINSLLQKCEIERRSYLNKIIRMSEALEEFKFGDESSHRVFPKKNEEGESKFIPTNEEIQFSNLQKTDFVVYARRVLYQQRIMIQLKIINQNIQGIFAQKQYVLESNRKKLIRLNQTREKDREFESVLETMIEEKIRGRDRKYFEEEENAKEFKAFCGRFGIVRTEEPFHLPSINGDYERFPSVPLLQYQLQDLVSTAYSRCLHLKDFKLPPQLDLFMIKANSYISIRHRSLRQNIDSVLKDSSKDQDYLQKVIRMQINSIFQEQISNGLLTLDTSFLTYSMVSSICWDKLFTYTPKLSPSAQLIHDKLNRIQFFDPDIRGLFSLFDISQEHLRDFTFQYVQRVINKKSIYNYLKLKDLCPTKKHKVIEILVRSLNKKEEDVLTENQRLFLSCIDHETNKMLMATGYNLIFIRCLGARFKLFHILNAQNSIEKSVISKLAQVNRFQIPFQLSDSFNLKFSRYQSQQVDQYLHKKHSSTQEESIQEDDKIQYINEEGEDIPTPMVRCHNRRDNEMCQGQYIVYKKTEQDYKLLCKKMEKICCYYIQKHQNNLPFSDFNEIMDRYQMMMDIVECEMRFNYSKLKLMEEYLALVQHTVWHKGVVAISESIMRVKHIQYIIKLNSRYFLNQYSHNTQILQESALILHNLSTLFKSIQSSANSLFKQRCNPQTITNQMPQVSLNYYCLDSSLKKKEMKQEKQELSQSQHLPSNTSYYDNNQYFLKKDFKEYLENNHSDTNLIDVYNKKREELIGFNEKLTMNDELLGAPIWFEDQGEKLKLLGLDTYEYLWNIISAMSLIEGFQFQCSSQKLCFYSSISTFVSRFHPHSISAHQPFEQNHISMYLQKCSWDIRMFQQTLFKQPLSTLSKLETHTLENYMNCEKIDLTSYRGLYLCVNFVALLKQSETQIVSQISQQYFLEGIVDIIKEYGDASLPQLDSFQKAANSDCLSPFPEILSIRPTPSNPYQYLFPSKMMIHHYQSLHTFATSQFFKEVFDFLCQFKFNYLQSLQDLSMRLQSKCCLLPNTPNDYMVIKQQLKRLEGSKSLTISKDTISEIITLRDLMYIRRKRENVEQQYQSISDIVFHKKYINKLLNDVRDTSIGIYEAAKYYRYREKHFRVLKEKVSKLLKIMPSIRELITMEGEPSDTKQVLVFPDFKNILPDVKVVLDPSDPTPKRAEFVKYHYEPVDTKARKYLSFFCHHPQPSSFTIPKLYYPMQISTQYNTWYQILLFLQNSLMLFSLELSSEDNQIFRQLIMKGESIDDYLYESSKHLLSPEYLNRLRRRALQSQLFISYEHQYRIFDNLKSSYKLFVKEIEEVIQTIRLKKVEEKLEVAEVLTAMNRNREKMVYIALKQLQLQSEGAFDTTFNHLYNLNRVSELQLSFVTPTLPSNSSFEHCPFNNKLKESLGLLFSNSLVEASQYISKHQHRFESSSLTTSITPLNPHLDQLNDIQRRFILQRINQLHQLSEMYLLIKPKSKEQDILTIYYKLVKMRELVQLLKIQDKTYLDEKYIKIMEVKHHQGALQLTTLQRTVLTHAKNIENGKIYQKVSQRILHLIVETKILEQIFIKYVSEILVSDLSKQINLLQHLDYDKQWQDKFKQQKCIKQLQNKVLVPKIKLNPFFSSPLCLSNYFIPHTSKLAFVQSFLNRLRNKVMQVELIDNEFGFLVKSHDLEECVQFLCKSFISFSEKEYESRTRKLVMQMEMFDSELSLTKQDLVVERNRANVAKSKVGSLIKAEVFTKINSILLSYFNIKNREELMIQKLTSIETQFHEDLTAKYLDFIRTQAMENQVLAKQFDNFKQLLTGMFKSDIQASCEILQDKLSQNISKIIGKSHPVPQTDTPTHQIPIGYSPNQLHQKQLKKQNYLYKLKLGTMQQRYDNEIESLKRKLQDKEKVLNSLLIERRKSDLFLSELNSVNQQHKKCQAGYQELKKKYEDIEHRNYKLSRLVEQANMKLSKNNFRLPSIIDNRSTISRNFSTLKDETMVRSISFDPSKSEGKIQTDWKSKYQELSESTRQITRIVEEIHKECQKALGNKLGMRILEILDKREGGMGKGVGMKGIEISPGDVKVQMKPLTKSVKLKTDF